MLGRGGADRAMLLLDTSFLIEFEDELAHRKMGPARGVLAAHRRETAAISIITLGEFRRKALPIRGCACGSASLSFWHRFES